MQRRLHDDAPSFKNTDNYVCYNVVGMARRTEPFSVRLGSTASILVAEEMRRSGRPRSAVVEELAEEAAKTRLFPGIAYRGSPRRAWAIGSGLDVWEIVALLQSYGSDLVAMRTNHPSVTERHVRVARAYAARFPAEIEQHLIEQRRPLEELRQLYPFLQLDPDD